MRRHNRGHRINDGGRHGVRVAYDSIALVFSTSAVGCTPDLLCGASSARTHRSDRDGTRLQVTVTTEPADPKSAASAVAPLPHPACRSSTDCRSRCSISAR
jgi:hypothetical protein